MKTKAAILVELGQPLEMVDLEIPVLKQGQALVEVIYSGVCHTQLLEARGLRGEDKFLPHCLGHEGSGRVLEVGPGVQKVVKDNFVILSWMKGMGQDCPSTQYQWSSKIVNAGAITTFSELAVISENRLTPIEPKDSLKLASLTGCAFATGAGAVTHTAAVQRGQGLVVVGLGGVGLSAIFAAKKSQAAPIVAVDLVESKLEVARLFGATHVVNPKTAQYEQELKKIFPQGPDVIFEAAGQVEMMKRSLTCLKMRGGKLVVIGNAPFGKVLEIDPTELNMGKSILGTWGGDNNPDQDFSRYLRWISDEGSQFEIFFKTYSLDQINQALSDLADGKVIRPLIQMKGGK